LLQEGKEWRSFIFSLHEWIGDLFASVNGTDEDEESAARDDEAEGASGEVVFFI
jgi:hypothetical protein